MVALPILYRALPSWRRLGIGINKMLLSSAYDKKSHYIKLVHSRRVTSNKRRTTTYKNARYSGQFKRSTLAKVTSLFVEVFMIGCYSYFLTTLLSSPFFSSFSPSLVSLPLFTSAHSFSIHFPSHIHLLLSFALPRQLLTSPLPTPFPPSSYPFILLLTVYFLMFSKNSQKI